MNKDTTRIIKAIAEAAAADKAYREVNKAAMDTLAEVSTLDSMSFTQKKALLDAATSGAFALLDNARSVVIWVTNGSKCAVVSALAYPNAGSYETSCGVGPADVDEEAATSVLKQLVDGGDIGYITEDTEADLFEDDETEDEKKPHLFEAVKAAGSKGITLSADNIGDFDFSGLEFWTPEAELSLAKTISECLNAPNVVESIKNGTTTTEEAVKDIIATFKETHEGNLIYKFAADAEAKPKATPKAE